MSTKKWILIGVCVALLMVGPFGLLPEVKAEKSLSFWNMPFVTQEVSPEYVKAWETDAKKALPDYKIDNFYGPGKYKDQRTRERTPRLQ